MKITTSIRKIENDPRWDKTDILYSGELLGLDDYLLKLDTTNNVGFLSKTNKDGSIPKNFQSWRNYQDIETCLFKEIYRSGWKIISCRFWESQGLVRVIHPLGFQLEIYMTNFFELLQNNKIINGVLQGKFKWYKSTLIREDEA